MNSSGPFSKKTPKQTNPANFSLPPREEKDNLIDPKLTSQDIVDGDLDNLYISPVASFRNTSYNIGWRTMQDLAEHANQHVINNTFGTSNSNLELAEEGNFKLFIHQELMYQGLLAGMSFLDSHKYALKWGPQPVHNSSHA